jgi:hypothetical protein
MHQRERLSQQQQVEHQLGIVTICHPPSLGGCDELAIINSFHLSYWRLVEKLLNS